MSIRHPEPGNQDDASVAPFVSSDQPGAAAGRTPMYGLDDNDPRGVLIDRTGMSREDVAQISELMQAMGELRRAEDRLTQASLDFMDLGKTDMRALHFLMVAENTDRVVTASTLAEHLEITSASTTKLLDRLERGGHITRRPHPSDRRSFSIHITSSTRSAAMETVGAQQSRRFYAAARLTSAERDTVIRFLRDTAKELETGMDWGGHSERAPGAE